MALMFALVMVSSSWACDIIRQVSACETPERCAQSAQDDFAAYRASQLACGVEAPSLPFIAKADKIPAIGTVVLVHGLRGTPEHMNDIAKRLQAKGYNVVAPILTGHGGEDILLKGASVGEWENDVKFAGEIAKKLGGPLYIGGHSTGGVMAALEASAHPQMYKAIFGLDPALNLAGKNGWQLKWACGLKHVFDYPSEVRLDWFLMGAPLVQPKTCFSYSAPRVPGLEALQEELRANFQRDTYCPGMKLPHYNKEFLMSAICALSQATIEMTQARMQKLPPALTVLSTDNAVFGFVGADLIRRTSQMKPENKFMQTHAPSHPLMVAHCSPDFEKYMPAIEDWLGDHR